MPTDTLLAMLQCPDCGEKLGRELVCVRCKRAFATKNDIAILLPKNDLPILSVYGDINYKKYHEILAESHAYFYNNPNPIVRWAQQSLYRSIARIIRNDVRQNAVLEIGSGPGKLFEFIGEGNLKQYVVLDIDLASLDAIKNKPSLAGIVQGTAYKLPFCSAAFDTVISCAQLEHLCYLDAALEEAARVLKLDGTFIASVPTEGGLLWTLGRQCTSARYFGKKLGIDYIRANRIDHFNTIHQIDRALRRHFTITKTEYLPLGLPSFDFNFSCTYRCTKATKNNSGENS